MIILPAIDIKGGKCVRLFKGDFNKLKEYKKSPLEQAKIFISFGFKNLHIVDLDGAKSGRSINKSIIREICKLGSLKIQVGGGIRSTEQIKELLDFGIDKVILGTKAIEDKKFLLDALNKFENKIALSLDAKGGFLASSGWTKKTNIQVEEYIKDIKDFKISRIIFTDINKDGTKTGPNLDQTLFLSSMTRIPFIISGGISSIDEIITIKNKNPKNIEGIIIGKAIYDGNIDLQKLSKLI